jgi:hypothetical protein
VGFVGKALGKIVGVVAVVAAVALAIPTGGTSLLVAGLGSVGIGISAVGAAALVTGLSVASSLLARGPKIPASQVERLNASIDPRAYRKTVLGSTAMATDIRYQEWHGKDQERCTWIVALASHAIDGVDEIWLNDELAWSATGGVTSKYNGYFWVRAVRTEGTAGNTVTFGSGSWNSSARLTGCAYAQLEFKVTGNSKKAESPFSSGIPSRITIIGRGARLYDPRRDSTVPGGSGAMRANDQATWRYTADDGAELGENLALQILRVLIGGRINGKLATGYGVPIARIDLPSFLIAANQCDEPVNRSAGGMEPRFRGAGVLSEGDDPAQLLDMMLAACCGRLTDTGGKLGLLISHNDLAEAATDDGLNEDDVIGPFQWNPDPSLEATPTVVRGRYTDARPQSLYQLIPYPDVTLPGEPEGPAGEVVLPLDLACVESPSQAQRVVRQALQRAQYDRTFTAPFDIRAWGWRAGQVVPFTFAPLGFQRRLFRVVEQERGAFGQCVMTLREENAAIYAWDANDAAPVQVAEPIVYDSANNPLILGIGEAAETALWTEVVDSDPVNHPKPEDGATKGAPAGTPFGDAWEAQQAVHAIETNAETLIEQTLRVNTVLGELDLRSFIEGQPIGPYVLAEKQARIEGDAQINTTIALLGQKTQDGNGFILNAAAIKTQDGRFFLASLEELEASLGEQTAKITELYEVYITPSGGLVKAGLVLNVDGHIVGTVQSNDGTIGKAIFLFDAFQFADPNGGQPITVIEYDNGILRAPNLEVDTFKAKSITIESIAPGLSDAPRYTNPDVQIGSGETTLIETPEFAVGDGLGQGSALALISFVHDGTQAGDAAATLRIYQDTGDGWELIRQRLSGSRVDGGDQTWSYPLTIPLSLQATGSARIKFTGQSYALGSVAHPSWVRDIAVDLLRIGR